MLNPDQFRIEDQSLPPFQGDFLPYRYANRRLAVVGDIPETRERYFAEQVRLERRGVNGRVLKSPREVVTPGASPGTAAFADYAAEDDYVRIDYLRTRRDMQGQGMGNALVDELASRYPEATIDLGRVMHPSVWSIGDRLQDEGRTVHRKKDF